MGVVARVIAPLLLASRGPFSPTAPTGPELEDAEALDAEAVVAAPVTTKLSKRQTVANIVVIYTYVVPVTATEAEIDDTAEEASAEEEETEVETAATEEEAAARVSAGTQLVSEPCATVI